jgi:hypothetical protein
MGSLLASRLASAAQAQGPAGVAAENRIAIAEFTY